MPKSAVFFLITLFGEFYFTPKNPVNAYGVGQYDGDADDRYDEHNFKRFLSRGGVVDVEAVADVRIGENHVGVHGAPKEQHQEDHRYAGGQEGLEVATKVDLSGDIHHD